MIDVIAESLAAKRFAMMLLGLFAALATVLASVGIYGVMSHIAGQQTHEIGIRMALGAKQADVLRMVLSARRKDGADWGGRGTGGSSRIDATDVQLALRDNRT